MSLRMLAGAAALAVSLVLPGVSPAQTTLSMGSAKRAPDVGASSDQEFADALKGAAPEVGGIEIQFIGNEQEMVQQVLRGRIDLGATSPLALAAAMPEIAVLNVPYLWISQEERDYVYANHLKEPLAKLFADHGLVLLSVQEAGYNGVFCKFDCSDPASLAGQKARVSPSASSKMFWDSLGAIPVQLPLSDAWPALEQNLVVAGELPIGFFSTTPGAATAQHFVFTNHTHSPWFYFAGQRGWGKLGADSQAAVMAAMPALFSTSERFFAFQDQAGATYEGMGGTLYRLDADGIGKWAALVQPNIEGFIAGMGPEATALYQAVKAGKDEFAAKSN